MTRTIIVKNVSGQTQTYVGRRLADGDTFELPFDLVKKWANDTDVRNAISNGDIIINDGNEDLSPEEGLVHLVSDVPRNPEIPGNESINIVVGNTSQRPSSPTNGSIRYNTDINGMEIYVNNSWRAITKTGSAEGVTETLSFHGSGVITDTYLTTEVDQTTSDIVPAPIPFNSKILAISFSNSNPSSEFDLELNVNNSLVFTWEIRGNKSASNSTQPLRDLTLNSGDNISIFVRSVSSNDPENILVKVLTQILKDENIDTSN